MTLLELLGLTCFTTGLLMGIIAGKSAGAVGIIVGLLIGLGTGGLGFYTLKLTADYSIKLHEKSLPKVVAAMIDFATVVWIGIVIVTAAGLADFITKFIIRHVAA